MAEYAAGALLENLIENKEAAFMLEEGVLKELQSSLPAAVKNLEKQIQRVEVHLLANPSEPEQRICLPCLRDQRDPARLMLAG